MTSSCKVIPFRTSQAVRRERRWERIYFLFARLPQYLSLGALALYAVLRLLLVPEVPFSYYIGPLSVLWPLSFFLLLLSYVSDLLLWRE